MKVYVAGKTQDLETVRAVQRLVVDTGHRITHDWAEIVEKVGGDANEVPIPQGDMEKYAKGDMYGVYYADLVIAVGHPNLCGTFWECGMALAWSKPIWTLYWNLCARRSIFDRLPSVTHLSGRHDLIDRLVARKQLFPLMEELASTPRWDENSLD